MEADQREFFLRLFGRVEGSMLWDVYTGGFGYFCGSKVTGAQRLHIKEKEGFLDWIPYLVRNDEVEGC